MKKEILFSYFSKMSYKKYKDLLRVFSSLENAWQADFESFKHTGWESSFIQEFFEFKKTICEEKIEEELKKENMKCLSVNDLEYPDLLKQIYDPPICLFVRGALPKHKLLLGMVGSRNASGYGKQVVEILIPELVKNGAAIISGLALGIDGLSHKKTILAEGTTVAVLGGGVDRASVRPQEHKALAEEIILHGGAVISEYPPRTEPTRYSFPKRNRIIAGMTHGTIVVEAGEGSGSLITAECALEAGREVFAVPGPITSTNSEGVNSLIKNGAKLITSAEDILETFQIEIHKTKKQTLSKKLTGDTPEESQILKYLHANGKCHIDEIARDISLQKNAIAGTLTMLELKQIVKTNGNMIFELH